MRSIYSARHFTFGTRYQRCLRTAPSTVPQHMTRPPLIRHVVALLLISSLPFIGWIQPTVAQVPGVTVECGPGLTETNGICLGSVARSDSLQQFEIQLQVSSGSSPSRGVPVLFKADSGAVLRDSVVSDTMGIARTLWYRARGSGPAGIAADIRTSSGSVLKYVQLRPRETHIRLRTAQDARLANFAGGSGRSLIVEILKDSGDAVVAIDKSAECARHRVIFLPEGTGAKVTPDTATAEVYKAWQKGTRGEEKLGCFASARLALGSDVGLHEIRTVGLPSTGYRVVENAHLQAVNVRHLPQIIVAGVASYHRPFTKLDKETIRTYRVQRTLPSGETATFDSAIVNLSTDERGGGSTTALIGFSTPIPWVGESYKPANLFNLTFGLDPIEPRRGQFFGLSVLRSTGLVPFNFPVDLHLLAHVRQIDRVQTPESCAQALTTSACNTESKRYWGPAGAVSFDASALIADAIKKLAN